MEKSAKVAQDKPPDMLLLPLLAFMSCCPLWPGLQALVGLSFIIRNPNIDDAVRAARPEATDQNLSTVFIEIVAKEVSP
jgi:hypothetical protein